jgi:signal transduction histidine kinase
MWTAAVVVQLVALRPVLLPEGEPLPAFLVMYHVVGFAFTSCGLAAWRRRPDSSVGRLMTTAGFLLYAWPVIGQIPSPGARIAASILEDLWAIPMVALLLTHHSAGRLTSRMDRLLVAPFVIAVPLELSALLFIDQEGNPLLLIPNSTAAIAILTVSRILSVVACLAVAVAIAARWRVASRPQRRAMLPSVAGIISLLLFAALNTMADPPPALLWAAITSLMVVPAAFLTVLLRSRLARAGLAQLIRDLDRKRGPELEAALGRALGDPGLVIAYPAPGGGGAFLDSHGVPISLPTADHGSSIAPIEHHGCLVAVLVYDASLDDDPDLVEAVRAAATIALENVRMQQETQARLAELRDSRSRIVAAGDAERRRIERNLHDGAQQRLATLALQLASIQSRIREDPGSAELMVSTAADELTQSLQELRELARGIHPSVLEHGLRPGLESLANRSAVPTSVVMETDDPLPSQVAFAAYFVTSEALANVAKHARATSVTVRVKTTAESLILQVIDDGIGGASEGGGSGLRGLVDRVEALEGHLDVQSDAGLGTTLTAVLPRAVAADQPDQPRQSPMTNS